MKTLMAVFALVAIAKIALAGGNLRVDILPLTAERAVVAVSSQAEAQYEISIKDVQGDVVYYKQTEGNIKDYRKVFDFSRLEKGDYTFIATINGATSERTFSIGSQVIEVGNIKNVVDPVFSFNNDILRVAYLNYQGEKLDLKIYDQNNLIYSKSIDNEFAVTAGLNLAKLSSGNYQVVLAGGNDVFYYTLNK